MKTNFETAAAIAIETVAKLLGISPDAVAEKAKAAGPVRDAVAILVVSGKEAA